MECVAFPLDSLYINELRPHSLSHFQEFTDYRSKQVNILVNYLLFYLISLLLMKLCKLFICTSSFQVISLYLCFIHFKHPLCHTHKQCLLFFLPLVQHLPPGCFHPWQQGFQERCPSQRCGWLIAVHILFSELKHNKPMMILITFYY